MSTQKYPQDNWDRVFPLYQGLSDLEQLALAYLVKDSSRSLAQNHKHGTALLKSTLCKQREDGRIVLTDDVQKTLQLIINASPRKKTPPRVTTDILLSPDEFSFNDIEDTTPSASAHTTPKPPIDTDALKRKTVLKLFYALTPEARDELVTLVSLLGSHITYSPESPHYHDVSRFKGYESIISKHLPQYQRILDRYRSLSYDAKRTLKSILHAENTTEYLLPSMSPYRKELLATDFFIASSISHGTPRFVLREELYDYLYALSQQKINTPTTSQSANIIPNYYHYTQQEIEDSKSSTDFCKPSQPSHHIRESYIMSIHLPCDIGLKHKMQITCTNQFHADILMSLLIKSTNVEKCTLSVDEHQLGIVEVEGSISAILKTLTTKHPAYYIPDATERMLYLLAYSKGICSDEMLLRREKDYVIAPETYRSAVKCLEPLTSRSR